MLFLDSDNDKLSVLPISTTGSLNSIITTSVASSEPDPGSDKGDGDGGDEKLTTRNGAPIKEEEWWKTTLQVSIPFFIAGIGTIGAGIILGRVEVSYKRIRSRSYIFYTGFKEVSSYIFRKKSKRNYNLTKFKQYKL